MLDLTETCQSGRNTFVLACEWEIFCFFIFYFGFSEKQVIHMFSASHIQVSAKKERNREKRVGGEEGGVQEKEHNFFSNFSCFYPFT